MAASERRVLNVGGNDKRIPLPAHYAGWRHDLLDIDPSCGPDIVCDARRLAECLPGGGYDAVYCAHNLEHYYRHEVPRVLGGFWHVLKPRGFAEIIVPDLAELMRVVVARRLDLEDTLYQVPGGPIRVRDVIYGWGDQIERSGNDFFAHKTGFSSRSLSAAVERAGFAWVVSLSNTQSLETKVFAFKTLPSADELAALGLPAGLLAQSGNR